MDAWTVDFLDTFTNVSQDRYVFEVHVSNQEAIRAKNNVRLTPGLVYISQLGFPRDLP